MKKFVGVIIVIAALFVGYQWFENNADTPWTEQVSSSIQQTIDHTKILIEEGLSPSSEAEHKEAAVKSEASEDLSIVDQLAVHLANRDQNFKMTLEANSDDAKELFSQAFDQAMKKDSYVHYVISNYRYTQSSRGNRSEFDITVDYRESAEMTEQVRSYARQALELMNIEQYSDYEKIKLIHDWIVTHVQYDQTYQHYTAYEAITTGTTVCQGYSLLGMMFFTEAGFDAYIVAGIGNGEDHAWNKVRIGDLWYNVDMTWNDPIGQKEDGVSYKYYLVSDEVLAKDHIWEGDFPAANISYKDYLKSELSKAEAGSEAYQSIQQARESLLYHLEDENNMVTSSSQLSMLLKNTVSAKEHEIQFIYAGGDEIVDEVKKAFKGVNTSLSYKMSYSEYNGPENRLVSITITYR